MTQRWIHLMTGLVLTAAAGCTKGPPPGPDLGQPHPVHGTVTFPGKTPLKGGLISFTPTEIRTGFGKVRYQGTGLVDANGAYTIGFANDGKGVPPGEYKVTMEPREVGELPNSNSAKIPKQYKEKSQTPFTVKVKEGDNTFDFELK